MVIEATTKVNGTQKPKSRHIMCSWRLFNAHSACVRHKRACVRHKRACILDPMGDQVHRTGPWFLLLAMYNLIQQNGIELFGSYCPRSNLPLLTVTSDVAPRAFWSDAFAYDSNNIVYVFLRSLARGIASQSHTKASKQTKRYVST